MDSLQDPRPSYDLKSHSITLAPEDLARLDDLMLKSGNKNRSSIIRACIFMVHSQMQSTSPRRRGE